MNLTVVINDKSIVALGVAVGFVIFSIKMDAAATERVSIHAIDACKDLNYHLR